MCSNLIFQDQDKTFLFEFLYKVEKYFTYEIYILTSGYSGKCNFCIPEDKLKAYVKKISKIMNDLSVEFTMEDCESDAYIKVYLKECGYCDTIIESVTAYRKARSIGHTI